MCSYSNCSHRNVCANPLELPEQSVDEAVLDFEMPEPVNEGPDNFPGQHRVVSEEDLVGEKSQYHLQ